MTATWDFPYAIDGTGRTATTSGDEHARDLIEQLLLTSPQERVMRPDFGSGLLAMVFEPGGQEAAATLQYLVQGALEQWLADVIALESVAVDHPDGALVVTITYVVRATGTRRTSAFSPPGATS